METRTDTEPRLQMPRVAGACLPEAKRAVNKLEVQPQGPESAEARLHRLHNPWNPGKILVISKDKPRRSSRRIAWAALIFILAQACHHAAPKRSARPERVVSLSPSTTEAVFALGAGSKLVGRSLYSDYPPAARRVSSVGGFADPSYEAILALAPDLVVGVRGPSGRSIVDRLQRQGIATYFPPTDSMSEILAMLQGLGARLGDAASGRRLAARVARGRDRVVHAVADLPHPRALLVFGVQPIVVAGPGGFPDELLHLAGATNVVQTGPHFPTLSVEELLALDPDVIVDTTGMGGEHTRGIDPHAPGWSELRAVKRGRLVRLTDERVLRPGPRIAEGLAALARALHPRAKIP